MRRGCPPGARMLGHLPRGENVAVNRMQVRDKRAMARMSGLFEDALLIASRFAHRDDTDDVCARVMLHQITGEAGNR